MPVRNQNFYDLNESIPYPLSDEATGIDDSGVRLPSRLLADLHLAFPVAAGHRAMLGAVTITRKIVTVTILATETPQSTADFVPLAAISLPRPVDAHRMYALDALYPGAGGWIVFGSTVADEEDDAEEYTGRFSLPAQSILLPSTAKAYEDLPIPSFAKLGNSQELTGLVQLVGGNDIEIVAECREIPAYPASLGEPTCDPNSTIARQVIVIRLREDLTTGADARNVFDIYRGPCENYPESGTCGSPAIEFISSVTPDCCGNLTVLLRGCAGITEITQEIDLDEFGNPLPPILACGAIIDCALSMDDVCVTPDRLPDAAGNLPNEVADMCSEISEISVSL